MLSVLLTLMVCGIVFLLELEQEFRYLPAIIKIICEGSGKRENRPQCTAVSHLFVCDHSNGIKNRQYCRLTEECLDITVNESIHLEEQIVFNVQGQTMNTQLLSHTFFLLYYIKWAHIGRTSVAALEL